MRQPVTQKTTVFLQRMAQSSSTALVNQLPGSRVCPCPSFPLSRIEYRVWIKETAPTHPGAFHTAATLRGADRRANRWGACLQRQQAVPAAQVTGHGVQQDTCGAAPLCGKDALDPFTRSAQAPSSLFPARVVQTAASRRVKPKMQDASHGPCVGKLETPHALSLWGLTPRGAVPSPAGAGESSWLCWSWVFFH